MMLVILNCPLVRFGRALCAERPKISAFPRLGILLAGIKAILSAF